MIIIIEKTTSPNIEILLLKMYFLINESIIANTTRIIKLIIFILYFFI
jgi:hypothetical protein